MFRFFTRRLYICTILIASFTSSIDAGLSLEELSLEMQQMKRNNRELTLEINDLKESNVSKKAFNIQHYACTVLQNAINKLINIMNV